MKERMFKLLGHLFQYVGAKQLVMCCTGLFFEVKIPEELKNKD
ncbi:MULTISPECIES: cyclic lactone autoinducer peptide [Lactiplantibacillus]|uniref:Cyclic lactone autoinducer peptide n=1 Tax=Lactiplantibacillus paraplantarum TaxID=60520 RepID=A0A4Q9XZN2_9LACO|nr:MULTISPECIES: cyclic lactone autoinducer peptide [Lactiplantibacillus]MCT4456717.1 cyclic lactone autoinducer peptide [Lactiplantibacillus paraplantarum]MDV0431131.1 cyclic lactone autoinducer peptide [Lactiplantibacillus sp. DA1]TBX37602.1 cyclic lactone autoinducer peptide [Lactiplantibacillus paraplantarum]WEE35931.1 cyclic lactone autoinducer peptide [Lactiplantibacillus paraplantarum]